MDIKLMGFNEAPTAKEMNDYLTKHHLHEFVEVADAKRRYYQNDVDTLVLRIKDPSERLGLSFDQGVALALAGWENGADEFDNIIEDYRKYYRFWWD